MSTPELSSGVGPIGHFDAQVTFTRRPRLLRAEQRVPWRLATLVLTLSRFNKQAASIRHLHIIGWAMRSSRSREAFLSLWEGRRSAANLVERLDPNLAVTLNLGLAHELIALTRLRVALTDEGKALAAAIDTDKALLTAEKAFLSRLGGKLSDAQMDRTFRAPAASDA